MYPIIAQVGDNVTGLGGFVSGLTDSSTGITASGLWDQITPAVGFIVMIFLFAFGYRFVRKLLSKGSKGKV